MGIIDMVIEYKELAMNLVDKQSDGTITPKEEKMLDKLIQWYEVEHPYSFMSDERE